MESKEISTTILDTTRELITLANMPRNQIKREMDVNYLDMLVKANPTLKKEHFVEFITKCQISGADPRMNQIYLIVHDTWNSQTQTKEPKGTTVFSYQFFIRLAQQTGQLEDFDVEITEESYLDLVSGKRRPSLTAKAWVKRKGQGKLHYRARLWEFAKTTKDGSLMGNWKASPYLMLEKCAVANVMRWAFPEVLGNFYVADEMEKATHSEKSAAKQVTIEAKESGIIESETPEKPPVKINHEDEFGFDKNIEDYRRELMVIIEGSDIDWNAKIGKEKDEMLSKVVSEVNLDRMKIMYEFVMKVVG